MMDALNLESTFDTLWDQCNPQRIVLKQKKGEGWVFLHGYRITGELHDFLTEKGYVGKNRMGDQEIFVETKDEAFEMLVHPLAYLLKK